MSESRLLRAVQAIAAAGLPDPRLLVPRRYRVVRQVLERVDLQAVRAAEGMPDLVAISLVPGVPGMAARLEPGAIVLVSFVEGDPALPVVTHFEGEGGAGWLPVSLALDARDEVQIGRTAGAVTLGAGGPGVAREGDSVAIGTLSAALVGGVVQLAISDLPPVPGSGAVALSGSITSSSSKVRAE